MIGLNVDQRRHDRLVVLGVATYYASMLVVAAELNPFRFRDAGPAGFPLCQIGAIGFYADTVNRGLSRDAVSTAEKLGDVRLEGTDTVAGIRIGGD